MDSQSCPLISLPLYKLEINTWHHRCVKVKVITTAGLGFDFVVPEGIISRRKTKRSLKCFSTSLTQK